MTELFEAFLWILVITTVVICGAAYLVMRVTYVVLVSLWTLWRERSRA